MGLRKRLLTICLSALLLALALQPVQSGRAQRTQKPPLHGRHWMAITGKPLGATAASGPYSGGYCIFFDL
jgi:gamma-glutamyltranspeptidase/glutathione hydrolase